MRAKPLLPFVTLFLLAWPVLARGATSAITVTLDDGTSFEAASVRPQSQLQYIQVRRTDGTKEQIAFHRVKRILGPDGRDWTRRVLFDGKRVGTGSFSQEIRLVPRAGAWDLGAGLALLAAQPGGIGEIRAHAGVFLTPWLEVRPTAGVALASSTGVGKLELSGLLHGPAGPWKNRWYGRVAPGRYFVTPGKKGASALALALGLESAGGHSWRQVELGWQHVSDGPDLSEGEYVFLGVGFAYVGGNVRRSE